MIIDHQEFYRAGFLQSLRQAKAYQFDPLIGLDIDSGIDFLETEPSVGFISFDTGILAMKMGTRFKEALTKHPNSLVIALSDQCSEADPELLCSMGVTALLPRTSDKESLHQLFRLVINDGFCMPCAYKFAQQKFRKYPQAYAKPLLETAPLTNRQKEILKIVTEGKSNKEIGRILGISEGTVRTHLKNIFKLLQATNRTEAAYIAIQNENRAVI